VNDLKNLLEKALVDRPLIDVDPAADLMRGRNRLQHRRKVTLAGTAAVALGIAIIPLALNGTSGSSNSNQAGPRLSSTSAPSRPAQAQRLPALELVAYTGKQIPGYQVASVPKGWQIQGGDASVLTIAPKGFKDKDFSSFVGKIVVMLQSKDAAEPTEGAVQEVDGRPGRLDVQGDTQLLTYQIADKRWMVIQAPTSLGWDGTKLAQFASGVKVLDNAEAGVG
jgi:hypothetical protein